jgi:hypothetical protein
MSKKADISSRCLICERCYKKEVTLLVLCDYDALLAELRFCELGASFVEPSYYYKMDHAIAQAVSRWLPTMAARVRSWVWSSGICGGQSGAGAGFLRVLRFPLPIFIPPIA